MSPNPSCPPPVDILPVRTAHAASIHSQSRLLLPLIALAVLSKSDWAVAETGRRRSLLSLDEDQDGQRAMRVVLQRGGMFRRRSEANGRRLRIKEAFARGACVVDISLRVEDDEERCVPASLLLSAAYERQED